MTEILLSWPDKTISKEDLLLQSDENTLNESINDLYTFKRLEERGYGDILLARYACQVSEPTQVFCRIYQPSICY